MAWLSRACARISGILVRKTTTLHTAAVPPVRSVCVSLLFGAFVIHRLSGSARANRLTHSPVVPLADPLCQAATAQSSTFATAHGRNEEERLGYQLWRRRASDVSRALCKLCCECRAVD